MAIQTLEKNTENGAQPPSDVPAVEQPHPLASVLGSFRDDPDTLDAIMAGVEKYRQQMEAEKDPIE